MKLEYRIRVLAGTLILAGLVLAHLFNHWWLVLPAFVGLNLIQSAFTGFCPAEKILAKVFPDATGCCCGGEAGKSAGGKCC